MRFERITAEPDKLGGIPCIRGLRVPVATVVGMVAEGMTTNEILEAYPYLEADDIREALEYDAEAGRVLLENLGQFAADLQDGALVVIGDERVRVRRLPIA